MKKKYYSAAIALMICAALTGCAREAKRIPDVMSSLSAASASASAASADISSVEGVYAPETAGDSLPLGNEGRLYFDDGTSVALNGTSAYDLDSIQHITDQEDSAYYGTDGWTVAICDHARQAFAQLPDLQAGAHMYIIHADGTRTDYTMVSRYYASWSNGYVTLDDGRDPWNGDTQLFLQTCINASGTRDIITYWEPIAE